LYDGNINRPELPYAIMPRSSRSLT